MFNSQDRSTMPRTICDSSGKLKGLTSNVDPYTYTNVKQSFCQFGFYWHILNVESVQFRQTLFYSEENELKELERKIRTYVAVKIHNAIVFVYFV